MSSNDGPDPYGQSGNQPGGQQYGNQPGHQAYGSQGHDQYGQSPVGQPGYNDGRPPKNGLGLASLILGIISILAAILGVGIIFAIIGLILGILGLGRVRKGRATNRGVALVGVVTSVIGLIASIVVLVVFAVAGSFFWTNGGQDLTDCVSRANGDQAAIQQCTEEFGQRMDQMDGTTTDT